MEIIWINLGKFNNKYIQKIMECQAYITLIEDSNIVSSVYECGEIAKREERRRISEVTIPNPLQRLKTQR
jgi:hypothetical protein